MYIKKIDNEKGQVLLFVTVVMTIALSVGAAISTRTLSSISRVANIDTSNKVLSAAESAIEQYLIKEISDLKELSDNNTTETVFFDDTDTNISTKAQVSVEEYKLNNQEQNSIIFNLETGNIKEVNLSSYNSSLDLCWYNDDSAISYNIYKNSGISEKNILVTQSSSVRNQISKIDEGSYDNTIDPSAAGCTTINVESESLGIRIKALYNNTKVAIFPDNVDSFPVQGYKITAVGTLEEEGKTTASRTVVAYRSLNYLSSAFDYTFYTQEDFNN